MFKLTPKQIEYANKATARWNIKTGAVRSGKSYGDIIHTIPKRITERLGKNGYVAILGVSSGTVERNVLGPMREIYGPKRISVISSGTNTAYLFGEKVFCLGAEKISQVSKIQGSSLKYCYGDEIAKWNKEVFAMLKSRLDKPYSCFDGACNPENPTHWLKTFIDSDDIDLYLQHYRIFDNPYLDETFVNSLCNEYRGTVYYDRLIEGKWVRAEGLIYTAFDEGNIYSDDDRPVWLRNRAMRIIACDYGTTNPFVLLDTYDDGKTIWVDDELRWDSRSKEAAMSKAQRKTDEEYVEMTLDLIARNQKKSSCMVIVDPSAASFIAALRQRGIVVKEGNNDVLDGIRSTSSMFRRKRLLVNQKCKGLIDELRSYVWDEKKSAIGEDAPVKENDHGPDALRYRVNELPGWRITRA